MDEEKLPGGSEDKAPAPAIEEAEHDEETSEELTQSLFDAEVLEKAIKDRNKREITEIFEKFPDADIAQAAEGLETSALIALFRFAPSAYTAPLFDDLSVDKQEELIKAMTDKELVAIINAQSADDMADTVGDMPANLAKKVLKAANPEMRKDINRLLKYKDGTAGAIMTTEYLEFREKDTVGHTIESIRKIGRNAETVYTLFIRNEKRLFVGTVDLDELIFSDENATLKELLNRDAPYCHLNTDQEEVANMFRKYDITAMAVLNDDDCLTGIVTVDDAVDVMTEETTEDIEKMHAVGNLEDTYLETHPFQMMKKCLPWIIVLLVLGTFSSMVLSTFQNQLAAYSVLVAFIPTLMDTAGNAGGQTSALMVRGLALKEFSTKDFWRLLRQEIASASLIGLGLALFSFLWFTLEQYVGIITNPAIAYPEGGMATVWNGLVWNATAVNFDGVSVTVALNGGTPYWLIFLEQTLKTSAIVSLTALVVIILSKVIAVCLPIAAVKLKKDPAIVTQPMLTTIVDVVSLLIFFLFAYLLILGPLGIA